MNEICQLKSHPSEGCQPAVNGESFKFKIWRSAHRRVGSLLSFCSSLKMSSFHSYCDHLHFNISIQRSTACISGTVINWSHCRKSKLVCLQGTGYNSGFPVFPCFLMHNTHSQERGWMIYVMSLVTSALAYTNLSFMTSLVSD